MPDFSEHCRRAVHDAHALIEQWIGQADLPPDTLPRLLAHFSDDFSMVPPDGQRLPDGALPGLFARVAGSRPGLRIGIDELAVRHTDAGSAVLTYRESHAWNGGATVRRATAGFVAAADGRPLWRHLHETWVADTQ
ncbi:hypothetical protein [Achromobacter sp. UMC71]|uniref:hypothetical protein n=1 Tax=Achromobacter sp. UMC71 TaxID=1862320 RepID=UPI00160249F0|nr:hypothetical protein [Achromobacter sp. UMC71]MBB1624206.1 hypothetical protein [Achromobacter sp. UMC71]